MFKRIEMLKKGAILLVALLLLAAISAAAYANGNGTEQINWRIAGPIFASIENSNSDGDYALLNLTAKGNPGSAEIVATGTAYPIIPVDEQCPGAFFQLKFVNGAFVAVFSDQSMLFFEIDESEGAPNANCYYPGESNGAFQYNIVGGAGRYVGASGSVLVETTAWSIGENSAMSAEIGTITGLVELP